MIKRITSFSLKHWGTHLRGGGGGEGVRGGGEGASGGNETWSSKQ